MAKLIVRCNYFKNEPARHRANFIKYLGTREGVELNPKELPKAFWEDADMHGKKANYVDYLAARPGSIRVEGQAHGLFSEAGMKVDLEQAMDEVANHPGTVWINVISLKREDAERLGYDGVEKWQALMRGHVSEVAEAFHVKPENLKWYAAFHNEGHHPHVHLVVFSKGGDGYLSKKGIEKLKSSYVRDVFKDEMAFLYDEKTKQRKTVKDAAGENLLRAILEIGSASGDYAEIGRKMADLSKKLRKVKGKKVYGYLHKNLKNCVDEIMRDLERVPEVRDCYEKWVKWQRALVGYYRDDNPPIPPMSENPEFKSIKNAIIKTALLCTDGPQKSLDGEPYAKTGEGIIGSAEKRESFEPTAAQLTFMATRLLKHLQKTFADKTMRSRSGARMIAEGKQRAKELEKMRALGIKDEGTEDSQSLS
ncbi:MAG: hypothetical protein IKO03_16375 [Lachnospiraceae bacterium]|nr:hypothetical protein [Lachnospiraceae bacterium]